MPASLLAVALLLSISFVVSKLLIPGIVVPIRVVTSLISIPFLSREFYILGAIDGEITVRRSRGSL
ncbi:hypothetical protein [Candidatus Williamhamiltonella defendens]|uniref:hypothetical protein n=1 Tax=Candidatus Williamhamiltonella defendens TaxID=138072 RepID=UPI001F295F02|nr:hypothetical protein [Candidatus Hamiltonella defensa]